VYKTLVDAGVDFDAVDYYIDPIPKKKLRELIEKMKITPRELLRTNELIYRELHLGKSDLPDADIIDLMAEYPDLIQRPIVERGRKAILARPADRIHEIL